MQKRETSHSVRGKIVNIRNKTLDILFPIECVECKKFGVWLCEECFEKIEINTKALEKLELIPSYLDGFLVATDWKNQIVQDAVHKFKYNFSQELGEVLVNLILKKIKKIGLENFLKENVVIVPVPLHRRRYAWRGFNQAELLAKIISEKTETEMDTKIIKRIKYTKPQVKQNRENRLKNLQKAFKIKKSTLGLPKNVLLIDDVITTGSTMNEMARVLKENGVEKVWGMAIARG